jgi:hypothetical protein
LYSPPQTKPAPVSGPRQAGAQTAPALPRLLCGAAPLHGS